MLQRLSPIRVIGATIALLAVLMAIGWATRRDPAETPLLTITGGGFVFNYRLGEVYYGFTAAVTKPLEVGSIIEARFQNPAGGDDYVVRELVYPMIERYALQSPPVHGVKAKQSYHVDIRVLDRTGKDVMWTKDLQFTSQLDSEIVPDKPLVIGPGYTKNPQLTD